MKFNYTAITNDGRTESAVIEAADTLAAGHLLKQQGLIPTSIVEQKSGSLLSGLGSFGSVKLTEKIVFIQNLSIMIKAGIAAPKALKIIARQTKTPKFKKALQSIAEAVESGQTLSEGMQKHPGIFSNIFISMVKVGELSGNLDKSLEYLTIQLQREHDLKSKTKGAMIYPAVIVITMILVGITMATFVLPKLTATFKEFDTQLPIMTRIVIAISDFMAGHVFIVFGGLVVLVVLAVAAGRTPSGKRGLNWFLLRFPILNPIIKKINLARFARILSSLLKSGTPIVEGIQVTADSITNTYYHEALIEAGKNVKLGKPLTETLSKDERLFPYIVVQMLTVGEDTGTMETILEQIAEHFEQEVDDTMRNFSAVIEPLLLLVIGVVVGFLAVALISPIYSIGTNVK